MTDIAITLMWVLVPLVAVCGALLLFGSLGGSDANGETAWIDYVDHDEFQQVDDRPGMSRRSARPEPRVRLASDQLAMRRTNSAIAPAPTDVDRAEIPAASAAIGRPVHRNDLTVIPGIGPKTALLCHEHGINTWGQLSHTSITDLQTMLDEAGRRLPNQNSVDWPLHARLLEQGRWFDFVEQADTRQLT